MKYNIGNLVFPNIVGFSGEYLSTVLYTNEYEKKYLISHPEGFKISTLDDKIKRAYNIEGDAEDNRVVFAREDELRLALISDDKIDF